MCCDELDKLVEQQQEMLYQTYIEMGVKPETIAKLRLAQKAIKECLKEIASAVEKSMDKHNPLVNVYANSVIQHMTYAGHFPVSMFGEKADDFDNSVADYVVCKAFGKIKECMDSNGSEQEIIKVERDRAEVKFYIYDREYMLDNGNKLSFAEAIVHLEGFGNEKTGVFEVDKVISFKVGGAPFNIETEQWQGAVS